MARKKTKHRGVRVVQHRNRPGAKPKAQARWKDPRTGKQRAESLTGLTAEQREERLAAIAADLAEAEEAARSVARRAGMGVSNHTQMSVAEAADRLVDGHHGTKRGEEGLKIAVKLLKKWAAERGVTLIGEIGQNALYDLRGWIVKRPRDRRRNGCEIDAPLRPATINRHFAWLHWLFTRAAARQWCAMDLTRDAVRECLEKVGGRNAGKGRPLKRVPEPFFRRREVQAAQCVVTIGTDSSRFLFDSGNFQSHTPPCPREGTPKEQGQHATPHQRLTSSSTPDIRSASARRGHATHRPGPTVWPFPFPGVACGGVSF